MIFIYILVLLLLIVVIFTGFRDYTTKKKLIEDNLCTINKYFEEKTAEAE